MSCFLVLNIVASELFYTQLMILEFGYNLWQRVISEQIHFNVYSYKHTAVCIFLAFMFIASARARIHTHTLIHTHIYMYICFLQIDTALRGNWLPLHLPTNISLPHQILAVLYNRNSQSSFHLSWSMILISYFYFFGFFFKHLLLVYGVAVWRKNTCLSIYHHWFYKFYYVFSSLKNVVLFIIMS